MEDTDRQTARGNEHSATVSSRGWFAFFTGLNVAFFVAYMMCKPSENHTLSWAVRLGTAAWYLLAVCIAGGAGTWIMLPGESGNLFRTLFRGGLRGWIFLPAIALLLQMESIWAQLLAVIAAALMAMYLYRSGALAEQRDPLGARQGLFAAEIRLAPSSSLAFVLSLLIYGVLLASVAGRMVLATALLAALTFLAVLRFKSTRPKTRPVLRRAQPYLLFAAAFYLILISLSSPSNPGSALFGLHASPANAQQAKQAHDAHPPSPGYRTIVLWPLAKPVMEITPPRPRSVAASAGAAKPMVIPFFGPYWYFKFPGDQPGPNTRSSYGDPLKANVRSTDSYPLFMEAHQHIDDPIDLSCCHNLQIVFQNDVSAGALAVGISLADSHAPPGQSLDLGVKVVASRPADSPVTLAPPTEETLTFPIPKHSAIQRFDDISVTFVPDPRYRTAGRRVAVERFVLIP